MSAQYLDSEGLKQVLTAINTKFEVRDASIASIDSSVVAIEEQVKELIDASKDAKMYWGSMK